MSETEFVHVAVQQGAGATKIRLGPQNHIAQGIREITQRKVYANHVADGSLDY